MNRVMLSVILLCLVFSSCKSYNLKKAIRNTNAEFQKSSDSSKRVAYAVELAKYCSDAKKENLEVDACKNSIASQIQSIRDNYAYNRVHQNVIAIPLETRIIHTTAFGPITVFGGQKGLVPDHHNPYNRGFKLCGSVINLGNEQIKAVRVNIGVYDHFGKIMGLPIMVQKGFPKGLGLYRSGVICTDMYYKDITPSSVGKLKLIIDNVSYQ